MCGIAGYTTNKRTTYQHSIAIAIMAKHMDERGGHSWGCMDGTQTIHGLGSINLGLTLTNKMPMQFALHTRYGTTGARVVENSHPFTLQGSKGEVVGMHNGIISNHYELNRDYKRNLAVDSQHIFANLADGKNLNDLQGYGAIVYRLNGEWYVGRFNDGDMKVALTDAGVFFASTKDAIMEGLSYAGIAIQKWLKVKDNAVYRLTPEGLFKAYKVDATGTRLRWNDTLTQAYQFATPANFATATPATRTPANLATPATREDYANDSQCDWCGKYGVELFAHNKRDAVCADCYYAVTNEIPYGFDAQTY